MIVLPNSPKRIIVSEPQDYSNASAFLWVFLRKKDVALYLWWASRKI
jgi:hypothetical protein